MICFVATGGNIPTKQREQRATVAKHVLFLNNNESTHLNTDHIFKIPVDYNDILVKNGLDYKNSVDFNLLTITQKIENVFICGYINYQDIESIIRKTNCEKVYCQGSIETSCFNLPGLTPELVTNFENRYNVKFTFVSENVEFSSEQWINLFKKYPKILKDKCTQSVAIWFTNRVKDGSNFRFDSDKKLVTDAFSRNNQFPLSIESEIEVAKFMHKKFPNDDYDKIINELSTITLIQPSNNEDTTILESYINTYIQQVFEAWKKIKYNEQHLIEMNSFFTKPGLEYDLFAFIWGFIYQKDEKEFIYLQNNHYQICDDLLNGKSDSKFILNIRKHTVDKNISSPIVIHDLMFDPRCDDYLVLLMTIAIFNEKKWLEIIKKNKNE